MITKTKMKFGENTIGTTLLLFCIKMFLKAMSTRLQSLKKFYRRKFERLQEKEKLSLISLIF